MIHQKNNNRHAGKAITNSTTDKDFSWTKQQTMKAIANLKRKSL
jgi:hypothetical protein